MLFLSVYKGIINLSTRTLQIIYTHYKFCVTLWQFRSDNGKNNFFFSNRIFKPYVAASFAVKLKETLQLKTCMIY